MGIVSSFQNCSLAILPMIVALIYNRSKSYYVSLVFFISLLLISLILIIILICEDNKNGNILHIVHVRESKERNERLYNNEMI